MNTMGYVNRGIRAAVVGAMFALVGSSPGHAVTYRLTPQAGYIEGCFELCACPLWFAPMSGRFKLTPITLTGTYDTYAVTNVNWLVSGVGTHITGHGTYTIFTEFAVLNRLELDLVLGTGEAVHFDSGMVPVSVPFPRIDVQIVQHGAPACYDIRVNVAAKPLHGDINADGEVNVDDLLAVITNWGECPPLPDACPADVAPTPDGDRTVNIDDLLTVISDW